MFNDDSLDFIEEMGDEIDAINDQLTVFCEETPITQISDIIKLVEHANSLLRTKGLFLSQDDLENLRSTLETPSEQEVINYIIPVYKEDEQSDYNLVINYFLDDEANNLIVDMELQYFWEVDMDDEEEFDEYDID